MYIIDVKKKKKNTEQLRTFTLLERNIPVNREALLQALGRTIYALQKGEFNLPDGSTRKRRIGPKRHRKTSVRSNNVFSFLFVM